MFPSCMLDSPRLQVPIKPLSCHVYVSCTAQLRKAALTMLAQLPYDKDGYMNSGRHCTPAYVRDVGDIDRSQLRTWGSFSIDAVSIPVPRTTLLAGLCLA